MIISQAFHIMLTLVEIFVELQVQVLWDILRPLKKYLLDQCGTDLPEDVEQMRVDIIEKIEEAYALIGEKAIRQKTRKKHYEPQQHEFSADLLARQGEMLMVRGKWPEVIDNLERALELTPKAGKIRALLEKARQRRAAREVDI